MLHFQKIYPNAFLTFRDISHTRARAHTHTHTHGSLLIHAMVYRCDVCPAQDLQLVIRLLLENQSVIYWRTRMTALRRHRRNASATVTVVASGRQSVPAGLCIWVSLLWCRHRLGTFLRCLRWDNVVISGRIDTDGGSRLTSGGEIYNSNLVISRRFRGSHCATSTSGVRCVREDDTDGDQDFMVSKQQVVCRSDDRLPTERQPAWRDDRLQIKPAEVVCKYQADVIGASAVSSRRSFCIPGK